MRERRLAHRPRAGRLRKGARAQPGALERARRGAAPHPVSRPEEHPGAQRARAQPEEHRRRDPAREVHRGHRRVGLRQVHAGLRHPLRRGPAPLPRIAERLRAPVRAAGVAPDVDAIFGIPPTVAIEQRTSRGGRKSTVATLTEIYHFLRLLFVKLGTQHCPDCDVPIEPQSAEAIAARLMKEHRGERIALLAPLVVEPQGLSTPTSRSGRTRRASRTCASTASSCRPSAGRGWTASRSTPSSCRWPNCAVRPEDENGAARRGRARRSRWARACCTSAAAAGARAKCRSFSVKRACPACGRSFPELDPRLFSYNSKHGWCASCFGTGLKIEQVNWDEERSGPAPRTMCSTPGSSGWSWTRPAPTARAGGSTARRSRCASAGSRSPT